MMPDAMEAVTPSAWTTPLSPSRNSMAAAAAEPMAPQIEVACWPCSKKTELPRVVSYPAIPSRTATSNPTAIAATSSPPLAPAACPAANAAGTTLALGCSTDGRWVSS